MVELAFSNQIFIYKNGSGHWQKMHFFNQELQGLTSDKLTRHSHHVNKQIYNRGTWNH